MKRLLQAGLVSVAAAWVACPAVAQTAPNPAMNAPDQLAWQLFIEVNASAGGSNALFETWASDSDTFKADPQFPATPAPLALHPPIVPAAGRQALQRSGHLLPAIPPGPGALEETRRNKATFDFIKQNNLYKITGLRAAFGKELLFPVDSIEVKANWVPVTSVTDPSLYHINTGSDGKQYALVAMHIISKQVPNWTWATFEHRLNPSRCDIIGCKDTFGANPAVVPPKPTPNQGYADCVKTQALTDLIAAQAHWDPAFANYCLKGSQVDFTDNTGLDVRVGNSVTEQGFVDRASCMTCHGRASFTATGLQPPGQFAGFDNASGLAPLGPIDPTWYWKTTSKPPLFEGMPGLTRLATSADFVWSIPFCALDDTVNPPKPNKSCVGK
jgi:hypothetical protein